MLHCECSTFDDYGYCKFCGKKEKEKEMEFKIGDVVECVDENYPDFGAYGIVYGIDTSTDHEETLIWFRKITGTNVGCYPKRLKLHYRKKLEVVACPICGSNYFLSCSGSFRIVCDDNSCDFSAPRRATEEDAIFIWNKVASWIKKGKECPSS
jgi:hypothetical protein